MPSSSRSYLVLMSLLVTGGIAAFVLSGKQNRQGNLETASTDSTPVPDVQSVETAPGPPAATSVSAEKLEEQVGVWMRRGEPNLAIAALREHLEKHSDDAGNRKLLFQVLMHIGKLDDAVKVLEDGLDDSSDDYTPLYWIGQVRLNQAQMGPNTTVEGNVSKTSPSKDPEADKAWIKSHYELALEAFRDAQELVPGETAATIQANEILHALERDQEAADSWQTIYELHPDNDRIVLGYANALIGISKWESAIPVLEKAIANKIYRRQTYALLSDCLKATNKEDAAKEAERRAKFYQSLPTFTNLEFSEALENTIVNLMEPNTFERLISDKTAESSECLAALCWQHPHNDQEDQAFEELGRRGDAECKLLLELFDDGGSVCTVRGAARVLAPKKYPGLVDRLIANLPNDVRGGGMNMDIAGAMDLLGDPTVVPHLIEVVDASNKVFPEFDFFNDALSSRLRATLALGAFDTPESIEALKMAMSNQKLRPFAAAALYRINGSSSYLDIVLNEGPKAERFSLMIPYFKRMTRPGAASAMELLADANK